jgi:hypothetical protein
MYKIFSFLESNKITPNMFYMLICIQTGKRPGLMNLHTEIRLLESNKFLSKDNKLTEKAKKLINDGNSILASGSVIEETTTDEMIKKYLELFPSKRLPSGKPARQNKKTIENAFNWFFKTYEYTWDVVLQATAYYVDSYEKNGYLYMRNSQYFIVKTNTDKTKDSELADYCEIIHNGIDEESDSFFKDRVV